MAFCAVVLVYRASDILKLADEACNILHELIQLERRKLWNRTNLKVRTPVERPNIPVDQEE